MVQGLIIGILGAFGVQSRLEGKTTVNLIG